MEITKKTIKAVIQSMKSSGASAQDIEDNFKAALKAQLITLDVYCMAMEGWRDPRQQEALLRHGKHPDAGGLHQK